MRHWMKVTGLVVTLALAGSGLSARPLAAQVQTIDPNRAIDSDLSSRPPAAPTQPAYQQQGPSYDEPVPAGPQDSQPTADRGDQQRLRDADPAVAATNRSGTYERGDVFDAGERVFGKGAQGLAEILEKILKDQGEPSAYIAGREASGAALVGFRYGSGILSHRVEGDLPVYWTGPSVGFDIGGNASRVFVLVYNLYDAQEIYHRFPEGEGHLYFVGGFSATYLRRGNTVLIPIRLGVGLRAGVNVGYMKIRKKQHWLPF